MKMKSLYISSREVAAGKLVISMGMMEFLKAQVQRVAFFRPFVQNRSQDDDIRFFLERYALDMTWEDTFGFCVDEVEELVAEGKENRLHEILLDKIKHLENQYDFLLVEGLHHSSFSSTISQDLNLEVAKNASIPYLSILKSKNKNAHDILNEIRMDHAAIKASGCAHFATFVNRTDDHLVDTLKTMIEKEEGLPKTYLLRESEELDMPTLFEVKRSLACRILESGDGEYRRVVKGVKIAAMELENFLDYIEEGDLILVPADRADIILGAILALKSSNYPNISGILLTGKMNPAPSVMAILKGLERLHIPILSTTSDTYQTALKIEKIPARIMAKSERKIALAMGLFGQAVETEELAEMIVREQQEVLTPIMFEYGLFQKAALRKKRIVLPEALDERVLKAAETVLRREVVEIILLGNREDIERKSGALGLDIHRAEIIDPVNSPLTRELGKALYKLRKHKGLSLDVACDMLSALSYFGTMMVYMGYADGMVSGAVHTTQETIRPALQIIKTKADIPIVSSLFFMSFKTRVLVYADCAINQDPTAEELATIATTTADTAMQFGIQPRVAMLSYSTGSSGKGADVEKVAEATRIAKAKRPDLLIEGPIQYDAAVDPAVAAKKLPESTVAGRATIFIFPDLNTGNNTYKAVQRASGAVAIGPVLQGLKKPINDLSRGCLVADIVNTIVITAIQAGQQESKE